MGFYSLWKEKTLLRVSEINQRKLKNPFWTVKIDSSNAQRIIIAIEDETHCEKEDK